MTLELGHDLLEGRAYDFLIAATNFLGVTTTASATVDKLASPAPGVQFQGRRDAKHGPVRYKVAQARRGPAQPDLRGREHVVHGAGLRVARVAAGGRDARPRPRLELAEYTANPVTCRLPADALDAQTTYKFQVTVGFADTMTINNSAYHDGRRWSQDLMASISGGVEQTVAIGAAAELDGSESYDPDDNDAEGAMERVDRGARAGRRE